MAKGLLSGKVSVNTSANGYGAGCTVREFFCGLMDGNSEGCFKTTRNKALASSNGPMAGSSWGIGKAESNVDLEFLLQNQGQDMKEGGRKGSYNFGYKLLLRLNLNQTFLQISQS